MIMENVWVIAARPRTLVASICPVIMGAVLAKQEGCLSILVLLITLLSAIGIQITTNFANDYFDYLRGADTKDRLGPMRVTQAGLVTPAQMKRAVIIALGATALLGLSLVYVGGIFISLLLATSLILAIGYTKGRFAIAYLGLGEIFVFFFFGPIATTGTYYLQMQSISWQAALLGVSSGALSSCILLVNNIRDVEEDRAANKKTLIVRFGKTFGKTLYTALITIAMLLPLLFYKEHPYVVMASLTLFPASIICFQLWKVEEGTGYNLLLEKTAQMLLLFTLILAATWGVK